MKNAFGIIREKETEYKRLAALNIEAIRKYNEKILTALTLMGGILMMLPLLAVPFANTKGEVFFVYAIASALCFTIFFLFRCRALRKYSLAALYICFSGLFIMAIFLSVVHSPNMRATIILGAFCIVPLSFIDRPLRMNLFVAFWFALHTILSVFLKPQFAFDDAVNSLCFAVIGCSIGDIMILVRLRGYEAQRLLTIEKETDVLTGLFNRRKLYQMLQTFEEKDIEKPTGVLMIDTDYFKEYNDTYGHAAGDECLSILGEVFLTFSHNFKLCFYRYGGEEFVAMAYTYDKNELLTIAESLRIAVQNKDVNGHTIKISIGVAYCGDQQVKNYERIIDQADQAAYTAKRAGRNQVCMYEASAQ